MQIQTVVIYAKYRSMQNVYIHKNKQWLYMQNIEACQLYICKNKQWLYMQNIEVGKMYICKNKQCVYMREPLTSPLMTGCGNQIGPLVVAQSFLYQDTPISKYIEILRYFYIKIFIYQYILFRDIGPLAAIP